MFSKIGYMFAIALVLGISINVVNATLKCWRCSSDATNGAFCADPFDPDVITENQRYWSYVNCSYSYGVKAINTRPVCKKVVQEIYGKIVVSRSCFYQDIDDPSDKCMRDNHVSYIRNLACETCTTDGCNGAAGFAPIVALVLTPIAVAKLLLF